MKFKTINTDNKTLRNLIEGFVFENITALKNEENETQLIYKSFIWWSGLYFVTITINKIDSLNYKGNYRLKHGFLLLKTWTEDFLVKEKLVKK